MLTLLILVPLLGLMLLNFLPLRGPMKRLMFWCGIIVCLSQIYLAVFRDNPFWYSSLWNLGNYLKFDLGADNLSLMLLLTIGIVVLATFIASRYLIQDDGKRFIFMSLLLLILMGMNGAVLVKDIFSLYVFMEIIAVSSFILISFNKKRDALEGVFKYIILSVVATVFILSGIALLVLICPDVSFSALRLAVSGAGHNPLLTVALGLFLTGFFIKGGLVPFHGWLPDAYSAAPGSVSVLLAGIVTKVVGIYALMRLMISVFGFSNSVSSLIMLVGALSIIVGALAALTQHDFKRMLAYSSISQIGYILLSFGCGTALGLAGAMFHFFNHAIFKSLLFVNSAALRVETGTRNMDKMGGLGQKMPITAVTCALASLSTAGMPPLSGFWSKLIIVLALVTSGHFVYALIAVLASVLTLGYMLFMQRRVFFGKLALGMENVKETSWGLLIPSVLLAVIVVVIGLFPDLLLNNFIFRK